MSDVEVRPVRTEADEKAFLHMPWTVHSGDPNWVAPLWRDHVRYFDPQYMPELRHMDFERFVAWRGSEPVGTVIAFVNHAYNEFHEANAGWFGQFEVLEDREAAHALLRTAEGWVRGQGADTLMGPATYSTNSEIGLLVDGYDKSPMIMMTYQPPYVKDFVESYPGLEKAMDLLSWHFDGEKWGGRKADRLPEKLTRVVEKIRTRRNLVIRQAHMRDFDEEIEKLEKIYQSAWAKNWGFVPMSDEEMEHLKEELKPFVDERMVLFVEVDGEPIAFGAPIPNIYQPLRLVHSKPGEPHWLQLLRLVWHWKVRRQMNGIRTFLLGVLEGYRGSGADALLYYELIKRGLGAGYMDIEMSWILETNDMMNRAIQMLGAEVDKRYRVYQKAL